MSATLPYTIHFENDSSLATAPARVVSVRQTLDPHIDVRTFRLGSFGLGNQVFEVPSNRAYYSRRLDLRDSLGVYVDVNAGVDVTSREVFWVLRAIDPATGQAPENPLTGLLPVNDERHRGEGFVTYTVGAASSVTSGDSLRARASIVFDNNAPIETPEFTNLVDAAPPTSQVNALPRTVPSPQFLVTWGGVDDAGGSGLRSFDIFVRRGSAPYSPWKSGTSDTSGIFDGVVGEIYSFYSVAADNVGQREAAPSTFDAVTTVELGLTSIELGPAVLALYGARPNPTNADLTVAFSLASNSPATLEVFDVAGRRVASRAVGALGPGRHVLRLGGDRRIESGVYVIRLTAGGHRLRVKAAVVR